MDFEGKIALLLPGEDSTNLGNEMICAATRRIIERLPVRFKTEEFTFLRNPHHEEFERINACDRAVFVGTNIYQPDAVGWRWHTQDLKQVRIPYSLYGVGYSGPMGSMPLQISQETRDLVEWSQEAEGIGARDPQTVRWLRLFGVNSKLIGCPVLAYPDTFTDISPGQGSPLLAIREILLHTPGEEAKQAQRTLIDWFFKEYPNGRCVVQEQADLKLLNNKPFISSLEEIVAELSKARFVVSTRLHAGMLALAFGLPVVFIAHDTRVASFCEMIGMKPYGLTSDGLKEAVQAVKRIEHGDLSQFELAAERVPVFMRRLQEFLGEEMRGSGANAMRHPYRALTMLRRARTRLFK